MNKNKDVFIKIINEILGFETPIFSDVQKILQKNPLDNKKIARKSDVLSAFNEYVNELDLDSDAIKKIRKALVMKRTRTISGVTPVTVLTKPHFCPGQCIFCPNDIKMPKSYLSSEPGAQRASHNKFDPYYQTYNRLVAFNSIGHPTDKIELIILGGTWSAYPKDYQIWLIKRCFDAMNDFNAGSNPQNLEVKDCNEVKVTWEELFQSQKENETGKTRCIGLVVETRPELITEKELTDFRKFGATKVQMGIQSLDDEVLKLNKRGHNVEDTKKAFVLLRNFGFKIHGHWMPNLYGSTPEKDIADYKKLFTKDFCPDELKIYPCSLLETAKLMDYHKKGLWNPYTEEELLKVLVEVFKTTPRYCRLTRVIRDIPSQDIVVGNKKTNFRQIVDKELEIQGIKSKEIRSREVRGKKITKSDLKLSTYAYETNTTTELFMEYITKDDELAGFLRLSLPKDTKDSMIREIHVYGQSIELGKKDKDKPQHSGLGKQLIEEARKISKKREYKNMYVISSVGTKEYYRARGFTDAGLYQVIVL